MAVDSAVRRRNNTYKQDSPQPLAQDAANTGSANDSAGEAAAGANDDKNNVDKRHQRSISAIIMEHLDWITPLVLLLLSMWTRLRSLATPGYVVWDEAHFGKFGSYYLQGEFYHDVHPPLGKMLVALAGLIAGYDGTFEFKSGATYPDNVNYPAMRFIVSLFGVLVIPLAYLTALNLGFPRRSAVLVALMLLFDNGTLTITRFILLDPTLLFFTALSFFCFTAFHAERDEPFTVDWWFWLLLTGVALGMTSSVKWIGLFTVALVGFYTIEDLFLLLADAPRSWRIYIHHWVTRIVCLIVLPIIMYMLSFTVHFSVLNRSGPGDAQMSSLFKANLRGSDLIANPLELAYGSVVTFKNDGYGSGLLHSHVQSYPEGSQQQQVTCYGHKDDNNHWLIHRVYEEQEARGDVLPDDDPNVEFVRDGDIIRLHHAQTERNLHTHEVAAPVSTAHWEVSGYGNITFGDIGDYWKIEVVDDSNGYQGERIRSLTTRIRLRSARIGCLLRSGDTPLPEWGFRQAEVVCDRDADPNDSHNMWNIEWHRHKHMQPAASSNYRTRFLDDFVQVNVAMWKTNNALIPDEDKDDIMASQPWEWPFLYRGMRMTSWDDNNIKCYMLGNPLVWWSSTASLVIYMCLVSVYIIRRQRGIVDFSEQGWEYFTRFGKFVVGGWALNYFPFFLMGRVTYLHHYFPALYYSVFMPPFIMEHAMARFRLSQRIRNLVILAFALVVTAIFAFFWDVSFGISGPNKDYSSRRWLSSWNIVDGVGQAGE